MFVSQMEVEDRTACLLRTRMIAPSWKLKQFNRLACHIDPMAEAASL
jgi:hypothetical protein